MTEEKKSKNPFINMANQSKKNNPVNQKQNKAPKFNSKGFNNTTMVRRAGRGG